MSQSPHFPSLFPERLVSRLTAVHLERFSQFAERRAGQKLAVYLRGHIGIGGSLVASALHEDVGWKGWLPCQPLCQSALP